MLILQVALGIVLAVLILAYLPTLVTVTFWLVVIVIGVSIAGLLIYLVLGEPLLMIIAIAAVIALILREHRSVKGGGSKDLEVVRDQMQRRAMLGHSTNSLEDEVNTALNERKFNTTAQRERARRRALGYPK